MSADGIKVDALGFSEAVYSSIQQINSQMHGVTDRVRKGRAALNMLRFWLAERSTNQRMTIEEASDVQDMVEMALEALPHHFDDINDPVDEITRRAALQTRAGTLFQGQTEIALEALTVAAWPNASVSELNRQAQRLAEVADKNEGLVEAWESFKRLLALRDLVVAVERAPDGGLLGVSALNADAQKEYARMRRACETQQAALQRFEKVMEASHAE